MHMAIDSLFCPHAVQIVGVTNGRIFRFTGTGRAGQSSPAGPGEGPIPAVIVSRGVAAAVVGDGVAVIRRQQVLPAFVAVGIGVRFAAVGGGQEVPCGVISEGPGVGRARRVSVSSFSLWERASFDSSNQDFWVTRTKAV